MRRALAVSLLPVYAAAFSHTDPAASKLNPLADSGEPLQWRDVNILQVRRPPPTTHTSLRAATSSGA